MKKENGRLFNTFFIAGTLFAIGMAIYGYLNGEENLFWKFLIHFVLFGFTLGLLARRNYLKKQKKLDSNEQKEDQIEEN